MTPVTGRPPPGLRRRSPGAARPHAWPALTGLVLGLLALGPALGRGFVLLSYDMVFVPDPPVGSADLGYAGGPPRAVPSDLVRRAGWPGHARPTSCRS